MVPLVLILGEGEVQGIMHCMVWGWRVSLIDALRDEQNICVAKTKTKADLLEETDDM